MVRGAGEDSPAEIDHPMAVYAQTPAAFWIEHCGCAARAQQRPNTSNAVPMRF